MRRLAPLLLTLAGCRSLPVLEAGEGPAQEVARLWLLENQRGEARGRLTEALAAPRAPAELHLLAALLALDELDERRALSHWTPLLEAGPAAPEAELALALIHGSLEELLGERAQLQPALERLLTCPTGHCSPGQVTLATALLDRLARMEGDQARARALRVRGGWLDRWRVLGPLAPRTARALTEASWAERGGLDAARPLFRGRPVPTRELAASEPGLEPVAGEGEGLYVLETYLELGPDPGGAGAVLEVHLQDPARVALDGVLLHELAAADRRSQARGQLELTLSPGWHRLTVTLLATGASRPAFSLLSRGGRPLLLAAQSTPPGGGTAPSSAALRVHRAGCPPWPSDQEGAGPLRVGELGPALPDGVDPSVPADPGPPSRRRSLGALLVDPAGVDGLRATAGAPAPPMELLALHLRATVALLDWCEAPDDAERALARALAQAPRSAALLHARAQLLSRAGLPASLAHAAERQALAIDPTLPAALVALAHGVADEQPDHALALLDRAARAAPWAEEPHEIRFWILRARGWSSEAQGALEAALARGPSEALLSSGADFARSLLRLEEAARLDEAARALSEHPARRRVESALGRGEVDAALSALEDEAAAGAADALARAADLELARGRSAQAIAAAERALAREPALGAAWRALAAAAAAQGDRPRAAAALRRLLALSSADLGAAARLAELEGRSVRDPPPGLSSVSLPVLMARKEDHGWAGHSLVELLDQVVDVVEVDGSALSWRHAVTRLLTKEATDQAGEIQVPPQALLLALRTVKADGRVVEVDRHAGKDDLSFSELATGDLVERRWVTLETPSTPWGGYLRSFYFQGPSPVAVAEYVVRVPKGMPVEWWSKNGAPEPRVRAEGEFVVYHFHAEDVQALEPEPDAPDPEEYLPSVTFAAGLELATTRWTTLLPYEGLGATSGQIDRLAGTLTATAGGELERLERVFDFVRRRIAPGEAKDPAATLALGRGDRTTLFAALARGAGLRAELYLSRPGDAPPLQGPDVFGFRHPLFKVSLSDRTVWASLAGPEPWLGKAPPELRGGAALYLRQGQVELHRFREEEVERWPLESEARLAVNAAGDARGRLIVHIPGTQGAELRDFLTRARPEDIRRALESWASLVLPGAQVQETRAGEAAYRAEGLEDPRTPLSLEVELFVPHFMRPEPERLVAEQLLAGPMAARALGLNALSNYLQLPERKTPLLLQAQVERARLWILLPPGTGRPVELPRRFVHDSELGRYAQESTYDARTRTLEVTYTQSIPGRRVAPADFPALRAALQEVLQATRSRLVVPRGRPATQAER